MEKMRAKYYPYHKQSENLTTALDIIRDDMERGKSFSEFWTYWVDLPDDYQITFDTLDKLKELGFKVVHRYLDKGTCDESDYYIVAWDKYEEWPYDKEY